MSLSDQTQQTIDIDPYNSATGERALWRAVIVQALMDAGSDSKKKEMQYEKRQAIAWLTGYSRDFCDVCYRAGLEPNYVREKAIDAMKKGCRWRRERLNIDHFLKTPPSYKTRETKARQSFIVEYYHPVVPANSCQGQYHACS